MSDDFVLNVRQISQYVEVGSVALADRALIQQGGLGGPYRAVAPPNFVGSALEQGGWLKLAPGNAIAWNGASLMYEAGTFAFSEGVIAPLFGANVVEAGSIFVDGFPVATQPMLDAVAAIPKVSSFNGRTGRVLLELEDILRAGGVAQFNPVFAGMVIVPTAWDTRTSTDQAASTAFVQNVIKALLCSGSVVTSFNGRGGAIVLTGDDITEAGTANGARPQVNTAPYGDASKRIANTLFVSEAIYNLNMNLQTLIQEASRQQLAGYAPINSPQLTGVPTAPTAAPGSSTGQLATTAFVQAAVIAATTGVSSFNTRTGAVTLDTADITAAGGAPLASPALTGTPTAPTAAPGDNTTKLATTAFVHAAIATVSVGVSSFNTRTGAITLTTADITGAGGAPLASPALTGNPTAPTQTSTDNSTRLATTAFVQAVAATASGGVQSFNGRTGAVTLAANDISAAGGAPAASPALTGVPTAPTAAPGTSTTQLATTAFVMAALTASGVASFNGRTGAVTMQSSDIANAGGALLNSPAFSGTPTAPNPSPGTNNTQIATTSFVMSALGGSVVSTFNGRSGAVTLATGDVSGVGGALLASPTFTGTPAAPTPTAGDNSTKLATTAFVAAAIAGSVTAFNGRSGNVTLQASDLSGAGGALLASPALSGTPTAPTATTGTASNQLATCQFVINELGTLGGVTTFNGRAGNITLTTADITGAGGAPLASPAFTGTPTAPTPAPGTNTTQLATAAFVTAAIAGNPTLTQSDTAPTVAGNALWFDSVGGQLYVQYIDPTTQAKSWVIANSPQAVPAPIASGARVLLSSTVISAPVASVDLFGNWSATYDVVELLFYDVQGTADGQLIARLSMDGATFDAGTNYFSFYNYANSGNSGGPTGAAGAGIQLGSVPSANANYPCFGDAKLRLGVVGGQAPSLIFSSQSTNNSVGWAAWNGGGAYNPATRTTNVQGLRLLASTGNLTRGTIKLYGIAK